MAVDEDLDARLLDNLGRDILNILGTIWDVTDDLFGEEAFGGLLTPKRLKFLGMAVAALSLIVGFRLGLRRHR
jgi:hypothetical protein